MKLTFLEDGVLDYKGRGRTLATPEPVPDGALKHPELKFDSLKHQSTLLGRLKIHFKDCPQCSKDKLCTVGERIIKTL